MLQLNLILLSSLFFILSPVHGDIEQAFRQNSAVMLYAYFSRTASLNVSLPEPMPFADQLSPEQAYFLFKRFFATYKTFSFEAEDRLSSLPGHQGRILKARWSFRNAKNKSPYLFLVFFYLVPEKSSPGSPGKETGIIWRISEIKAERL